MSKNIEHYSQSWYTTPYPDTDGGTEQHNLGGKKQDQRKYRDVRKKRRVVGKRWCSRKWPDEIRRPLELARIPCDETADS